MRSLIDSTVIFHYEYHESEMKRIIEQYKITEPIITRINYLEILAGASENAKIHIRKSLNRFAILEFDTKAA